MLSVDLKVRLKELEELSRQLAEQSQALCEESQALRAYSLRIRAFPLHPRLYWPPRAAREAQQAATSPTTQPSQFQGGLSYKMRG